MFFPHLLGAVCQLLFYKCDVFLLSQSFLWKKKFISAPELSRHLIFYISFEMCNLVFVYLTICFTLYLIKWCCVLMLVPSYIHIAWNVWLWLFGKNNLSMYTNLQKLSERVLTSKKYWNAKKEKKKLRINH